MHKGHIAQGTIAGTGAAINVSLGFIPQHVRIINQTKLSEYNWFSSMDDAAALKQVTAGTISAITADGISRYAGTSGATGAGFTIGTDARLNANNDVIHYFAFSADA